MSYSLLPQGTTFQMVLATDYIQTHVLFLFQDGSTINLFSWQHVVVGYDRRDFVNYLNAEVATQADFSLLHQLPGNTGRTGEWYFNITTDMNDTLAEARCLIWSLRQEEFNESALQFCPCTRRQARRDWRYWFAYYWGLSSRPNCATLLFNCRQSTIECCYDDFGALIVGPNQGGSHKLYNPLFFFHQHFLEDERPYDDCCVRSNLCHLYYKYRPSDDCSGYSPRIPSK